MQYISFPGHALPVSQVCLGTMMFGDKCDGVLSEAIVAKALALGINAFDTAAMYSAGASEQYLGRALQAADRSKLFVTTKVVKGVDRRSIVESIDESLGRLQMEYVDLYLIHWPVLGMNLTEMMAGLNEVVVSGKTRLVGCCNFPAYLLASANAIAAANGWALLRCNQVAYNLFERGVEVEILPQARLEDIAITAYRPLAIGLLTGRLMPGMPMDAARRGATDSRVLTWLAQHGRSLERFVAYAQAKGVEPAQLAAAWVMHNPAVTQPILGVSSLAQVESAVCVPDVQLTEGERQEISDMFHTEVTEEGLQRFPGTKYNFPRLRRNLSLAVKE
jgi:aryl-alcohol dehydrogenase-like predicted oxidoreductase